MRGMPSGSLLDHDLTRIALWATRYTLGRMTYAVMDTTETLLRVRDRIGRSTRHKIAEEIRVAIRDKKCGVDFDCAEWQKVLDAYEANP